MEAKYKFEGTLWEYHGESPWVFITLPVEDAEDIRERVESPGGFGSVKVEATIGGSSWRTSVFPDRETGSFLLPVKKEIRSVEGLAPGDQAEVSLRIDIG